MSNNNEVKINSSNFNRNDKIKHKNEDDNEGTSSNFRDGFLMPEKFHNNHKNVFRNDDGNEDKTGFNQEGEKKIGEKGDKKNVDKVYETHMYSNDSIALKNNDIQEKEGLIPEEAFFDPQQTLTKKKKIKRGGRGFF